MDKAPGRARVAPANYPAKSDVFTQRPRSGSLIQPGYWENEKEPRFDQENMHRQDQQTRDLLSDKIDHTRDLLCAEFRRVEEAWTAQVKHLQERDSSPHA